MHCLKNTMVVPSEILISLRVVDDWDRHSV